MKKLLSILLSACMLFGLVGCSDGGAIGGDTSKENGVSSQKDMFNVVTTAVFTGFDPLRTNDAPSTDVNAQMYETLYSIAQDGSYKPLLAAEDPIYSDDGLVVTVKLKDGITFHDGTPFNAEAVKNTFDLIKDPEFGSARASLATSIESIDVVDDLTVQFNLVYPDGVFHAKMAHTNSAIVSPTAQKNQDLMVNPVGTGPYKFVSSVAGSNVVLTANENYWGEEVEIKDITITVIKEESTAIARLQTGEADFISSLSVEAVERLEAMNDLVVGSTETARITYMSLRPESFVNPLMGDINFRTAIAQSINKEGFIEFILNDDATINNSIVGPKVFGYTDKAADSYVKYDLEAAKKAVVDNGWQDEKISVLVANSETYGVLSEYVQANLKEAGFNNVVLETVDFATWLSESKLENRFDLTFAGWSNVTRDGTELFEPNFGSNSSLRNRVVGTDIDQIILDSKTSINTEDRLNKLEEANMLIGETVVALPLFSADHFFSYNPTSFSEVRVDPSGTPYYKDFSLAK